MKTRHFYFACVSMLVSGLVLQSCQQELLCPDEQEGSKGKEIIFTASSEASTRTSRQEDKSVWWSAEEEISVFYGSTASAKFISQNDEPAPVVQFKGSIDTVTGSSEGCDAQCFYAVYPFSYDNKCAGDSLVLSVPYSQTGIAGTFDDSMFPSVAKSEGLNLAFYNVCGGIKFSLSRSDVKRISLKANNSDAIAGDISVKFDEDGLPVIRTIGTRSEIFLTPKETDTFVSGEYYYITIPQVVFTRGFTMTFYTTDNKQGVAVTQNTIQIKRSVFASQDNIDSKVSEWTDIPTVPTGNESGFYLGLMGFNQNLYSYPVTYLSEQSKGTFDNFIDSMTMKKGTLLYYSVDNAISAFQNATLPEDVYNVAIITFTDGLDQGSLMMNADYGTDEEYLDAINTRLTTESVAGQSITAYSIGIRGTDVTDVDKFRNNLEKLATSSENSYEVTNMSEIHEKFQEIADKLDENSYVQKLSVCIPGQANGTRVRFTFDNVTDASLSDLYIEGVFNLRERSLEQVEYCGFTSTSGTVVKGDVDGIFVTFTFEGVRTEDNVLVAKDYIRHWNYIASTSLWQINSEFDNAENSSVVNEKKSAAIMLVLDCSSSLGDQFENMQEHAKSFVFSLYKASSVDSENIYPVYPSDYLSTTPVDLSLAVARNGVRYFVPQSEYPKLNLGAYTVEGLTVVSGDEAFIMALDERPVNTLYWSYANKYYELPDYDQGIVISARWTDINNALSLYGATKLSTSYDYWTTYNGSNKEWYFDGAGGTLYGNSSSYDRRFRQVISLEDAVEIPYQFDKYDELTLAITDGTKRRFLSLDEYQRGGVPAGYEAEGVAVRSKHGGFIISLTNASSNKMYYSAAVQLYGAEKLPTTEQCRIIGARWSWINDALKSFGGKALDSGTMAICSSSYYYYLCSDCGVSNKSSSSNERYVRLIVDTLD